MKNNHLSVNTNRMTSLAFTALGLWVAATAIGYGVGSVSRPGPGAFPLIIGICLTVAGAFQFAFDGKSDETRNALPVRQLVAIISAIIAWGLLVKPAGLVPATAALTVMALLGERKPNYRLMIPMLVSLPALGFVLFILLLGLPIRAVAFF